MKALKKFSDESGQTVILAAVCIMVLIGFLGLAIDVGHLRYVKSQLQTVADASALAAGMEIRVCGGTSVCNFMTTAAETAVTNNGYTITTGGANVLSGCTNAVQTQFTLQINIPPCTGPTTSNGGARVEAVASILAPTYFARVLGITSVPVSARAVAMRNPTAPCIYALDPTGAGAISLGALSLGVNSQCGVVDESNSDQALQCLIGIGLFAPKIIINGGTAGLLCGSTPAATTAVPPPVPADPLGYLLPPPQANDPCPVNTPLDAHTFLNGSSHQVNISLLGGTYVLYPGVYCGGIRITAALLTNVTFMPGVYILRDGPGMLLDLLGIPILGGTPTAGMQITLGLLSNINASGVMFYNETPQNPAATGNINITAPSTLGLAGFTMTAQTTGDYAGILFFQQHGDETEGGFSLGLLQNANNFEGAVYMPDATINYGVSAVSANYNILVGKDISFGLISVLTTFGADFSHLPGGSPLNGDDAILVQ